MERRTLFAEILLPVPLRRTFTYRVPFPLNDQVRTGQRAIVQFGDRRILTGLILRVHEDVPKDFEAKTLLEVLDEVPVVFDSQIRLFEWISSYYMCSIGEVMNAAMPAGLKLSSESMVQLHPFFDREKSQFEFSEKELSLLDRLGQGAMTYSEVSKFLDVKFIFTILKSLTKKDAIILYEEVKQRYRPRTEKRIRLNSSLTSHEALENVFKELSKKPSQEEVLLKYLQLVPVLQDPQANVNGLQKKSVENEISSSSLQTLIRKGILEEFETVVPRFAEVDAIAPYEVSLSKAQEHVRQQILSSFENFPATLLHGVTGSGKTEIYISLIRRALESETQVLYLLPEIALTTQIVQRLKKIFGSGMAVYHSRYSDSERVEVWNGVLKGKFKFVVGVRSSVFLPFDNLGLIIIDEEHDASYKQQDPAPRYHARDVALMLARLHHAKVLLGSATPSLESYYNAKQNKFGLIELSARYGDSLLPETIIADIGSERKAKTMRGEFSRTLLRSIEETLQQKEQVIIFQNRRGYSPMMSCEDCGWVPKCINCAVSLTYHQYKNAMICHYCGYRESTPSQCPTCTSKRIRTLGYGTEKLEEELKLFLPDAKVSRMDLDTTRSKKSYEHIIDEFEKGSTDILVGTQMVTKGLDFDKVNLVGVFNADRMIHFPDFRSYERAYQLITQVSGRAGRRARRGKVVIQTASPDHPLIQQIIANNYVMFFEKEISDRRNNDYPPFSRLIEIIVSHEDKKVCVNASKALFSSLKQSLAGVKILGPGEPMVAKIRNQFLMTILIKIPKGRVDLDACKERIAKEVSQIESIAEYRRVRIVVDVDPV